MANRIASGAICKVDEERRVALGWAYVAKTADGQPVVDHSGDTDVDPQNLEDVAFDYVLHSREGDEMHTEKVTSRLVESVVFTPEKLAKMGIAEGTVPLGWWVGFRIDSDATWAKVKDGSLRAFSVFGSGEREPINA